MFNYPVSFLQLENNTNNLFISRTGKDESETAEHLHQDSNIKNEAEEEVTPGSGVCDEGTSKCYSFTPFVRSIGKFRELH